MLGNRSAEWQNGKMIGQYQRYASLSYQIYNKAIITLQINAVCKFFRCSISNHYEFIATLTLDFAIMQDYSHGLLHSASSTFQTFLKYCLDSQILSLKRYTVSKFGSIRTSLKSVWMKGDKRGRKVVGGSSIVWGQKSAFFLT